MFNSNDSRLIDKYLPNYDVHDYHEARVAAEPRRAYDALRYLDLMKSPIVRALFAIRTIPSHFSSASAKQPLRPSSFVQMSLDAGMVILEEIPGQELVAGAVTQPWQPVVKFRGLPGPEFIAFAEPGFTKIAWNIAVTAAGQGYSLVSTETRVAPTDAASRRRFRRYWFVFSPGIRLIRRIAMRMLERQLDSERRPA
jgi:hypothetical protein